MLTGVKMKHVPRKGKCTQENDKDTSTLTCALTFHKFRNIPYMFFSTIMLHHHYWAFFFCYFSHAACLISLSWSLLHISSLIRLYFPSFLLPLFLSISQHLSLVASGSFGSFGVITSCSSLSTQTSVQGTVTPHWLSENTQVHSFVGALVEFNVPPVVLFWGSEASGQYNDHMLL